MALRASPLPRRAFRALEVVVDRLGVRLAAALLAAVLVFALFQALAEGVAEGETEAFDHAIRRAVNGLASPALTGAMRALTELGSPRLLVPFSLLAVAAFLRVDRRRAAVLVAVTMLGVALLDSGLKLLFQRERPAPFFGLVPPSSYSFPSGHALASFGFYGVLAALLAARTRRRALRILTWAAAAVLVGAVGLTRVYLGVHYPSDVLAGWAAAFVWVVAVASVDRFFRRTADTPAHRAPAAEAPVAKS
jgi:undecaprenyl-diphosphatase